MLESLSLLICGAALINHSHAQFTRRSSSTVHHSWKNMRTVHIISILITQTSQVEAAPRNWSESVCRGREDRPSCVVGMGGSVRALLINSLLLEMPILYAIHSRRRPLEKERDTHAPEFEYLLARFSYIFFFTFRSTRALIYILCTAIQKRFEHYEHKHHIAF